MSYDFRIFQVNKQIRNFPVLLEENGLVDVTCTFIPVICFFEQPPN